MPGSGHRSYGNEQWEFDEHGLMRRREASINDDRHQGDERRFHWPAPGPRPADVAGLARARCDYMLKKASASARGVLRALGEVFRARTAMRGPR